MEKQKLHPIFNSGVTLERAKDLGQYKDYSALTNYSIPLAVLPWVFDYEGSLDMICGGFMLLGVNCDLDYSVNTSLN